MLQLPKLCQFLGLWASHIAEQVEKALQSLLTLFVELDWLCGGLFQLRLLHIAEFGFFDLNFDRLFLERFDDFFFFRFLALSGGGVSHLLEGSVESTGLGDSRDLVDEIGDHASLQRCVEDHVHELFVLHALQEVGLNHFLVHIPLFEREIERGTSSSFVVFGDLLLDHLSFGGLHKLGHGFFQLR